MKITEKQLIESLSQLKEIKPRKEWASLLKSQILAEEKAVIVKAESTGFSTGFMDVVSSMFSQRKMAYSLATLIFIFAGLIGFARYTVPGDLLFPIKKLAEQSQASLTGQTGLQENVVAFNSRINDLAQVAKEGKKDSIPSAISEINTIAKNLKASQVNDPQTIKEIANSLKTLADVPGTDLTANQDVQDLYRAVVQSQIVDLQKTTLTDGQKKILADAEDLYAQGKYGDAFEKIYSINQPANANNLP